MEISECRVKFDQPVQEINICAKDMGIKVGEGILVDKRYELLRWN